MKTVEQIINSYLKKEQGDGLAICPTEFMMQTLQGNNAILSCDVLSKEKSNTGTRKSCKKKSFSLKKIRKQFHQKTKHFIVANINELERYFKTFVADSVYITNGMLYLFILDINYDLQKLERRYQRFHVPCDIVTCKDGFVLVIKVGNTKTHYWKEKWYYFIDSMIDILDIIGDALIN